MKKLIFLVVCLLSGGMPVFSQTYQEPLRPRYHLYRTGQSAAGERTISAGREAGACESS